MKKIKLSILVCSLPNRLQNFSVIQKLSKQAEGLPAQVLYLGDNKSITVGEKRNKLINIADGEYICFVDDDDRVDDHYIKSILDALNQDSANDYQLVTFLASVKINNGPAKICHYLPNIENDYNTTDAYFRLPNHLMVWKKDYVEKFPEINCGEDAQFGIIMKKKLDNDRKVKNISVSQIQKVLYHYDFNTSTTEAQKR